MNCKVPVAVRCMVSPSPDIEVSISALLPSKPKGLLIVLLVPSTTPPQPPSAPTPTIARATATRYRIVTTIPRTIVCFDYRQIARGIGTGAKPPTQYATERQEPIQSCY
ncbi:MAG: hypothetical protein ACUVR7_05430 [Armatimonadota bacterium]